MFLLSACLLYNSSSAQQVVTYHDNKGAETKDKSKTAFIRTIEADPAFLPLFKFKEHFTDGQLRKDGFVKSIAGLQFEGKLVVYNMKGIKLSEEFYQNNRPLGEASYYYDNGQLKKQVNYLNPPKEYRVFSHHNLFVELINYYDSLGNILIDNGNGFLRIDHEKGLYDEGSYTNKLKHGQWKGIFIARSNPANYEEVYENGKLISGISTDEKGEKHSYTVERIEPEYPGGLNAIYKFIANEFKYPVDAQKQNVRGRVLIKFVINSEGKITNASIAQDIGYGCGEEGLRVVNRLKKWKPGVLKGIPINVEYTLPIQLNLGPRPQS